MIKFKTKKKAIKTTRFQDTKFYFDDCPICRAMKKSEDEGRDLNEEELKEVFRKAKKTRRDYRKTNVQEKK